ncbi:MAG: LysR family transcriptional regulator [Roseiarcus sp.]|jgi:DNA-binding transcriptional LysR family regulator
MTAAPDWTSLRIFLSAIELGSIARAAERCGIANSAAAKRMRLLERDARAPLLERGARGTALQPGVCIFASVRV